MSVFFPASSHDERFKAKSGDVRPNKGDGLLYAAYTLFLAVSVLQSSTAAGSGTLNKGALIVRFVCLFAIVLNIVKQRQTFRQLLTVAIIGGVLAVSASRSGASELLITFGFIAAGQGISYKRIARISIVVLAVLVPVIAIMANLGFLEEIVHYRDGVRRSGMGFGHPNVLGRLVLQFALCWIVLRWRELGLIDHIGLLTLAFTVDAFTYSRTAFLLVLAALALRLLWRYGGVVGARSIVAAACAVALLAPLASLLLAMHYNPGSPWQHALDVALSGRLRWMSFFYQRDGFSQIGQDVVFGTQDSVSGWWFVLDNAYTRLAVQSGLVPLALFVAGTCLGIRKLANRGHIGGVACVLVFLIFGLFERHVVLVEFNFMLFAIASALYGTTATEPGSTDRNLPRAAGPGALGGKLSVSA